MGGAHPHQAFQAYPDLSQMWHADNANGLQSYLDKLKTRFLPKVVDRHINITSRNSPFSKSSMLDHSVSSSLQWPQYFSCYQDFSAIPLKTFQASIQLCGNRIRDGNR